MHSYRLFDWIQWYTGCDILPDRLRCIIWYIYVTHVMIWRYTGYHDMHADVQVAVIRLPYLVSWEVEFPVLVQYRHNITVQQQRRKGKQRRRTQNCESWHFCFLCRVWTKDKMIHKYYKITRRGKDEEVKPIKHKWLNVRLQ